MSQFFKAGAVLHEDFHPGKGMLSHRGYAVTGKPQLVKTNGGYAMQFVAASSQALLISFTHAIKSILFDVLCNSDTEIILDFDGGTTLVQNVAGTLTGTGFTSPTNYVQGVASSVLADGVWRKVAITTATVLAPTHIRFGYNGSTYGDIIITNIIAYESVLTASEIALLHS